jgi:hypothetical protein
VSGFHPVRKMLHRNIGVIRVRCCSGAGLAPNLRVTILAE